MDLNWFQSLIFGLISGLTDILPVSAQAHKVLMLTIFGADNEPALLRLFIHIGTLAALYYMCQKQILRIIRQRRLAKIPKRRRKRPVDVRVLLDLKLLQTMLIPLILGYLFYLKLVPVRETLSWTAAFLLLNAVILYLPVLLPSGNKDSRSMSRLEGLLMGLGGAASVLPGISSVGAVTSVGTVCGAERGFALNMSLLLHMFVTAILIIFDFIAIFTGGVGAISFGALVSCLLAAAAAFAGVFFGVRVMRTLAANIGFSAFAYYCLGMALLSFILFLSV